MHAFNYSFLKTIELPPYFLSLSNLIFTMKGKESAARKEYPSIYESLKQIAIVQSVKGSNAIEGIVATDKRIKALVLENSVPLDHTEQEIKGYQDALSIVHQNSLSLQFNEDVIRSLHHSMGERAQIVHRGEWKKDDNVITETHKDGSTIVRWNPVPASLTPQAMSDLVLAYRTAVSDSQINRLLLIPCVILDFLCIHPFDDGNGRVSRLLSLLLLNKADFDITRYVSFEEEINKDKGSYYEALEQSSLGWHARPEILPRQEVRRFRDAEEQGRGPDKRLEGGQDIDDDCPLLNGQDLRCLYLVAKLNHPLGRRLRRREAPRRRPFRGRDRGRTGRDAAASRGTSGAWRSPWGRGRRRWPLSRERGNRARRRCSARSEATSSRGRL